MSILKRGLVVVAMVAAAFFMTAGAASAAITPNPYRTTSGTGRFTAITGLGTSTCSLSGIVADAVSTVNGADGTISGFTASGCASPISSARYNKPIVIIINRGVVTVNVAILVVNIVGGQCLYTGTMTGTMTNGGNSATVRGRVTLFRQLGGIFCSSSADAELSATFPGASITW